MEKTRQITQEDTLFLSNYTRWACGPTFDMYFYCETDYSFEGFEQALFSVPFVQRYHGPEHPQKSKWLEQCILLNPHEWPVTIGARYVEYTCDEQEKNVFLLSFYPYHIQRLCGEWGWYGEAEYPELAALFMKYAVALATQIAQHICVKRVLFNFDGDPFPYIQLPGLILYTWITHIGQWPVAEEVDDIYSLLRFGDIHNNLPKFSAARIRTSFNALQQKESKPEAWDGRLLGELSSTVQVFWDSLTREQHIIYLTHVWCPTCAENTTISHFFASGNRDKGLILSGRCVRCWSKLFKFIEVKNWPSDENSCDKELSRRLKEYAIDTRNLTKDSDTVIAEYKNELKKLWKPNI